jgi:hypothetical protein
VDTPSDWLLRLLDSAMSQRTLPSYKKVSFVTPLALQSLSRSGIGVYPCFGCANADINKASKQKSLRL